MCDDFWDIPNARVVCRQLGFPAIGSNVLLLGAVPDGTGQIWLADVNCLGTELRLVDCRANAIGTHHCVHREDAGVECVGTKVTCTPGAVRLQGGTATSGRVEICNYNYWGTVCHDQWDDLDARVACVQLGLPSSG